MHARAARAVVASAAALVVLTAGPGWATTEGGRPVADATASAQTTPTPASSVGVPVATIGEVDCDRLEVAVTLDNSRTARSVTFGYETSFQRPLQPPHLGDDGAAHVDVAAGSTQVVVLPVRDDARTVVAVHLPDGGTIRAADSCGEAPAAVFGLDDCAALRLGVTLDNRRSSLPTRYRWTLSDPAGPVRTEVVAVPTGEVVGIDVPLVHGSRIRVDVTVDGQGPVATSDWYTCGRSVVTPRASIGAVACDDVSVALILDNSAGTSRVRVRLPAHPDVVLGAGDTRALRLHLPIASRVAVTAPGLGEGGRPLDLAVTSTARCAAAPGHPSTP